jgi:predicted HTH domain antitoxin
VYNKYSIFINNNSEKMSIVITEDTLKTISMSEDELLLEIAIMLFQQEKFTLGQASNFAKMNQLQLQKILGSRQISPHYDLAELKEDIDSLEANNWL